MNDTPLIQKCDELNNIERQCVEAYAGNLYESLNTYLRNDDNMQTYRRIIPQELAQNLYYLITNANITPKVHTRIIKLIKSMTTSGNIEWFRHIMFKFAMLLYGSILKCPKQQQSIEVYRGVFEHYLKEDNSRERYLTTFTSTSTNYQRARGFTYPNNNDAILYHFIITPDVSCIYIGTDEAELLLNPYQYYTFIKKEGIHHFYMINSSPIIPPANENLFSEFKREMLNQAVDMQGGNTTHTYKSNNKNTRRHVNKNYKNKNTRKNKKEKIKTASEHARARMALPIGSSSISFPLRPEVSAEIERIKKIIDERLKSGFYNI